MDLRRRPEAERLDAVRAAFARDALRGAGLARSLTQRRSIEEVLRLGVAFADPSAMRACVDLVVPRLGLVRFAAVLAALGDGSKGGVESALYWARAWPTDATAASALERVRTRGALLHEANARLERVLRDVAALQGRPDVGPADIEATLVRLRSAWGEVARDIGEEAA